MTRCVALLRGINVGGKSSILMANLRQLVVDLGHQDVETYIQSGNVIFSPPIDDPERVAHDIEKAISDKFNKDVDVLLRTASELDNVVSSNPFVERQDDLTKLLVTFLAAGPEERASRLVHPAGETGELALAGREVYVHCPDGYGRSKLNNAFIEKKLGIAATTRNWKTVIKLRDLTAR